MFIVSLPLYSGKPCGCSIDDQTRSATRFTRFPRPAFVALSCCGLWTIPLPAGKRERAWNLIVRQSGAEVSASILRVDGDSGAITGAYDGRSFILGHFSGARPLRLELTPTDAARRAG